MLRILKHFIRDLHLLRFQTGESKTVKRLRTTQTAIDRGSSVGFTQGMRRPGCLGRAVRIYYYPLINRWGVQLFNLPDAQKGQIVAQSVMKSARMHITLSR